MSDLESQLAQIEPFAADAGFRAEWRAVKAANKSRLAALIRQRTGIVVDPQSLFDVQVKRLHEYKRQHLNVAVPDHRLQPHRARRGARSGAAPRTVIFGGKAAPGYRMAKLIIRLIHGVADVINRDPRVSPLLKVVFFPDFNVKNGQHIYPAAELSEQISTAGKEASGTGNMKFAMNGALTIGTLDGANIEIRDAVGAGELLPVRPDRRRGRGSEGRGLPPAHRSTRPTPSCTRRSICIDAGAFSNGDRELFRPLVESLLVRDDYLLFADYQPYVDCQQRVERGVSRPAELDADVDPQLRARRPLLVGSLDSRVLPRHLERQAGCDRPGTLNEDGSRHTPGTSAPLGATVTPEGVNFSVFSKSATAIELLLFDDAEAPAPSRVVRLDPQRHRTYHYWHVLVPGLQPGQVYAYRAHGPFAPERGLRFDPHKVLLDPYGLAVATPRGYDRGAASRPGDNCAAAHEERRRRPGRLRLGGRPAASDAVRPHLHLRDARAGLHAASQLRRVRGEARDLRRHHREDPLPARPWGHGRRAPAGLSVRPRRRAGRTGQLLGIPAGVLLRAARRVQLAPRPARRARRVPRHGEGAASRGHRGDPRRRVQSHDRREPGRADDLLSRPRQRVLLHPAGRQVALRRFHADAATR